MGRKNIERVHISEFRNRVATVADMQAQRWDVISKCRVCGLMMAVDLALIVRTTGPETILWNRLARCSASAVRAMSSFRPDRLAEASMLP